MSQITELFIQNCSSEMDQFMRAFPHITMRYGARWNSFSWIHSAICGKAVGSRTCAD